MVRKRHVLGAFAVLVGILPLVSGCGGSGRSTPTAGGGGVAGLAFGPLQGRGILRGFVDSISTPTTTTTAIPGTFQNLNLISTGNSPAETMLVMCSPGIPDSLIRAVQGDGSEYRVISDEPFSSLVSTRDGLAWFGTYRTTSGFLRIARYDPISRAVTFVSTPPAGQSDLDVELYDNDTRLIYVRDEGTTRRILSTSLTGSSGTAVRTGLSDEARFPKVAGSRLFYLVGPSTIFYGPLSSGGDLSNSPGKSITAWDFTADGLQNAFGTSGSPSSLELGTFLNSLNSVAVTSAPSGSAIDCVSYSPNGREIAYRLESVGIGPIRAWNPASGASRLLLNTSPAMNAFSLAWVPMPSDRALVAPAGGSLLGSVSDGVIFSRQDEVAKGIISFDALTPAAVVMKAETGGNGTPDTLAYSVDADSITSISFVNFPDFGTVRVVGPGTSLSACTGFLVDFDNDTGKVGLVLPFTASRGTARSVRSEGATRVFRGEFLGVFDGAGRNLAPSGARLVRVSADSVRVE